MAELLNSMPIDTNFGQVPADWKLARLGDVASFASGGTPSKSRPNFGTARSPWASPKDLKQPFLFDTEDHISEAGLEDGSRLVQPGTLYRRGARDDRARDLPVSMVMVPMAFNQDMKAIIPGNRVDGRYLLYAFHHHKPSLLPEIGTSAHGTRRISTSSIENFSIPLPPLSEQRAIALALDGVRRAKESTEKTIAAARQLKASLMRHLLRRPGPVPTDRADRVSLKETDFGTVSRNWPVKPLESCSQVQTGAAKGRSLNGAEVSVPYLRVANVQDGYLDLSEIKHIEIRRSELPRFSLQVGDVVLTEGGDFDKLGRGFIWNGEVPGCVHQNHIYAPCRPTAASFCRVPGLFNAEPIRQSLFPVGRPQDDEPGLHQHDQAEGVPGSPSPD